MFGFIDTPGAATTPGAQLPIVVSEIVAPGTVAMPSPAEPDDPFADWRPEEFGRRLSKGRVRWGLLISMAVVFAGVAVAAIWIYERPQEEARQAKAALQTALVNVNEDLVGFQTLNGTLDSSTIDASAVNRSLLVLEDSNRRLFTAAGGLPASESLARGRVIQASGTIAEAQRTFTEAYTYRATVVPILAAPAFQTDPSLITLEDAAAAFSEWEARFGTVLSALPDGVFTEVTTRLRSVGQAVPGIQNAYLDALRTEDAEGAATAIETLERSLDTIGTLLFRQLGESKDRVDQLIGEAIDDLSAVPLMLG